MKKQYSVKHLVLIGATILLGLFILISVLSSNDVATEPESQIQQELQTQGRETVKRLPPKEVSYRVIEEEDISYVNCKRVGLRIVVPDDADKRDVDFTLGKIINEYKSNWDDITVWGYKYSDESQVGLIGFTMGMKEYSTCN